ncbi:hypothetical protein SERLA73DRAFT_182552 [Serpula lacrymans var. lacrymans S7.3]|uniref:Uncharacterized protein n=2 Tax=Serpula lacrymans var. lacrymans TaxID=341189 RepID=F8Q0H4_SERL3|nr:uncharacterized protein SERLADRAFT_469263 [Serpula lacrymans var. lacrymans S7.9]EGN97803.1 hypothetical protein SERLA73DRAFT_182552 [Serpula lacrymans var. lacrymans S7.3]EGO23395.1 hypothetical protein SERLADRAFT_469263 [Serpula lacrymans var. lacrymans S7.9]
MKGRPFVASVQLTFRYLQGRSDQEHLTLYHPLGLGVTHHISVANITMGYVGLSRAV